MNQFIYDMINMTEGQKLIKYWWILAIVFAIGILGVLIQSKLDRDIMKISKRMSRGDKK
ncbi:MAG TPA: hypothetical protein GX707_00125 [Epulopiscium sp.]|nr:hypothetical protein [Candidatus Epulonipiscium sp.]